MKYNTLGHTGLLVSELCLGTMTFAPGEGMWKSVAGVEQKLADELVGLSLDAGINFVDTADVYTNGESEKVLAQAIANLGIARNTWVNLRWYSAQAISGPHYGTDTLFFDLNARF